MALCSDRSHRNDHGVVCDRRHTMLHDPSSHCNKLLFWDRFLTKFESNILLSDLNSRKDLQAFVQVRGLPLNRSGPASSTYPRNVKGAPSDEPDGHMHAFDSATYELDTMRKKDSMKCGIEISKVVESRQVTESIIPATQWPFTHAANACIDAFPFHVLKRVELCELFIVVSIKSFFDIWDPVLLE
ncbi:hypothetical protein D9613_004812 [Agrocybe pediades]|uniref:Uncharacterized protein n=1 Tax=Agrocybe pediades TaxID=84607 RepID=A0A8H4QYW0_9AGAR|nr:hypothetical protein D9613_004812 [Agrocybe pediades]